MSTRVEELLARAIEEQIAEARAYREAVDALTDRVERMEEAIASLRQELEVTVEGGARAGVSGELETVAGELRRQISDLGRMIVNDLGRLPQIIRDAQTPPPPVRPPLPGAPDPGLDVVEHDDAELEQPRPVETARPRLRRR